MLYHTHYKGGEESHLTYCYYFLVCFFCFVTRATRQECFHSCVVFVSRACVVNFLSAFNFLKYYYIYSCGFFSVICVNFLFPCVFKSRLTSWISFPDNASLYSSRWKKFKLKTPNALEIRKKKISFFWGAKIDFDMWGVSGVTKFRFLRGVKSHRCHLQFLQRKTFAIFFFIPGKRFNFVTIFGKIVDGIIYVSN